MKSSSSCCGANTEGRIPILVLLFIAAVIFGFVLELFTVERYDLTDFPLMISDHVQMKHIGLVNNWRLFPERAAKNRSGASRSAQQMKDLIHSYEIHEYLNATAVDKKDDMEMTGNLWEDNTLLNITSFRWLRNNESICQRKQTQCKYILPVLVHTARDHFEERLAIRKTWGSVSLYKGWSVRLVFLLGEADRGEDHSRNEKEFLVQEAKLDLEHSQFGDLVTGSFIDNYRNLTYKHMMGYKWVLNFCRNSVDFVLKTDDDVFIDIIKFIDWRTDDLKRAQKSSSLHMRKKSNIPDLYCNTFVGTKPQRCVGCKWYASEAQWPLDYYPDYCSGWAYAITVNLMQLLYSVTNKVKFFWIDDCYATGALLEQVKADHKGFKLRVKHLWGQVKGLDFRNFRPMCENNDMTMRRKFGVVVPVARGSNYGRDMECLWNKTIYDFKIDAERSLGAGDLGLL